MKSFAWDGGHEHVLGELLEVGLLLGKLLLELEELLLLALADGHVLRSLLSALEGVSVKKRERVIVSVVILFLLSLTRASRRLRSNAQSYDASSGRQGRKQTHP